MSGRGGPGTGTWFALLGSIRAWVDGQEIELGSPQQRGVLAVLLLRDEEPVSVNDLCSILWDEQLPPGAAGTVRTYVYRLRRILKTSGAEGAIVSRPDGYFFRVRSDGVDVRQFENHVLEGRRSRAAGEVADAAGRFGSALALWRGSPLGAVGSRYLDSRRTWLEELRAVVVEEWLAAELDAGRSNHLVPDLISAVAEQPLRERLWELLLVALWRSGRQVEALAAYEDSRRLLRDELGVDPGPALREIHRRILAGEPWLNGVAVPMSTEAGVAGVIPKSSTWCETCGQALRA
jgi:DNA-binding SARP family transcriptional activator